MGGLAFSGAIKLLQLVSNWLYQLRHFQIAGTSLGIHHNKNEWIWKIRSQKSYLTEVQRLNGNGYCCKQCLRYSPSLQEHLKVARLQLNWFSLPPYLLHSINFLDLNTRKSIYLTMLFPFYTKQSNKNIQFNLFCMCANILLISRHISTYSWFSKRCFSRNSICSCV